MSLPSLQHLSDAELVEKTLHSGRTDAFGALYDRYAQKVYRKCMGFVKDSDIAQDLVQDILTKVFFQLGKFEGKSKFSTWLYAITYNHCIEYLRKNNKYQFVDIDDTPVEVADDVSDEELFQTQQHVLRRALEEVALEDRMILLMKYQDEMSIKEIMDAMSLQESAVKMRLVRARQRVKHQIERYAESFY